MMKTYDYVTSLFWLAFAVLVSTESLRLGIGAVGRPGAGFMAFGASLILAVLSLTLFLKTTLRKKQAEAEPASSGRAWKRITFVLVALLVYAKLVTTGGYLLSTFLLMNVLFWIVRGRNGKWWQIVALSFVSTIISYYVFAKLLNCDLPYGLFDF